jgi:hypothetical protein
MGLLTSLTSRLVRSEDQSAGADAARLCTEEDRLLATLDPELAAKVKARLAGESGMGLAPSAVPAEPLTTTPNAPVGAAPAEPLPIVPAGPFSVADRVEGGWDTSRSIAPPG